MKKSNDYHHVYFKLKKKIILTEQDVVIIKLPEHYDGRFDNEAIYPLIRFLNHQQQPVTIKIYCKLNSIKTFNEKYCLSLKNDLIKQINRQTSLKENVNYFIETNFFEDTLLLYKKKLTAVSNVMIISAAE